jgi:hypothetical protein
LRQALLSAGAFNHRFIVLLIRVVAIPRRRLFPLAGSLLPRGRFRVPLSRRAGSLRMAPRTMLSRSLSILGSPSGDAKLAGEIPNAYRSLHFEPESRS